MRFFNNKKNKVFIEAAQCALISKVGALLIVPVGKLDANPYMSPSDALQLEVEYEILDSVQVLVRFEGRTYVTLWNRKGNTNVFKIGLYEKLWCSDFFLTLDGKPIKDDVDCSLYDIHEGSVFIAQRRLRGGADGCGKPAGFTWEGNVWYTHDPFEKSLKFEGTGPFNGEWMSFSSKKELAYELGSDQRLQKKQRMKLHNYEAQALQEELDLHGFLSKKMDKDIVSLVEDLGLLMLQVIRAPTHIDRMIAFTVFCKSRSGKSLIFSSASLISDVFNDLLGPEAQALDIDSTLMGITDFRELLANWDALKESTLVKKLMRVYKFAIAVGVFSVMGIEIDSKTVALCKQEMGFDLFGASFVVSLLDAVALIIQRALMFMKTGTWQTFFHGPKSYGKWYDDCCKIKRESQFVGNLEAVGTNYHQYVKDVAAAIEAGEAILKFGDKTVGFELKAIKTLLNEMKMIQATLFTYNEAQAPRRPPFAMMIHSGSQLAKSTFVDMMFNFLGQIADLPTGSDFKYTRNCADPFWSGWNSSKWFILLDDIAYIHPTSNVQDMSLYELISLVNDVPLVPNQASLEDKGKNPVRAKVLLATTNTKHLNAHAHFACPLAVQRRLPFVVNLTPKAQYAVTDSPSMLDPSKLPAIIEDWPDFWNITIEKVVDAGNGFAKHEEIAVFSDIHSYLDWVKATYFKFQEIQKKATLGCEAMKTFKVCKDCNRVKCECLVAQAAETYHGRTILLPDYATMGEDFRTVEVFDGLRIECVYTLHDSEGANYMCVTRVTKGQEELRRYASPIRVVENLERVAQNMTTDVDYADAIAEVVRAQAERTHTVVKRAILGGFRWYMNMYMTSRTVRNATNSAMEWSVVRKIAGCAVNMMTADSRHTRALFVTLGEMARRAYMIPRWKWVLAGIATASAAAATYGFYHSYKRNKEQAISAEAKLKAAESLIRCMHTPPGQVCEECGHLTAEEQGLRASVVDSHFVKTETENPWKRDDYEVSTFDMTPSNVNYKTLPFDQLTKLVLRNVVRLRVSNGVRVREGNAFCVGGHLWVTNSHTVFEEGDLEFRFEIEGPIQGTSPNILFRVRQSELFRMKEYDFVWFQVMSWEPKRDLRAIIRKPTLSIKCRGAYVGYNERRAKQILKVDAVVKMPISHEIGEFDAFSGWVDQPTVLGDCGMPLISIGEPCVAILGLHSLGQGSRTFATAIDSDMVARAEKHFETIIVQCGFPVIDAPSAPKQLTTLRVFSPLRWLEKGSIRVFGSFTNTLPTSRSKVTNTLLGKKIQEERGWDVDGAAPVMNDWRPLRLALLDVTQQKYGAIDTTKLKLCAKAFVRDITKGLKQSDLDNLQVLSDEATVNGIAGVKFIDKMNFASSMGEPYRCQKKQFIAGGDNEKYFNSEIRDRISTILAKYRNGQCAHPVFGSQVKDEVRSKAKVAAGKLRLFSMAPADWSFVVRKYLLTIVKVIQENPFLFEASPGCATQTMEWEAYYDYLTQFGVERMVAGDYGKFDKKMEASIILMAFWVLIQILKFAGWEHEDLVIIQCIGEDTAYSYCNFAGDLVQFFGSNPSGHPLTVIINCIVNALYMRYCFGELCPGEEDFFDKVCHFKEMVALLTYGDDNTMGVSEKANWFNHTAIQDVLASIGVEYTMADKESESQAFIHIKDVSYLKRRWRWDKDIGAVVCPLEESSIQKMLTMCLPSKEISREFHMAAVMVSAANEFFWYGRERFERERAWLLKLALENGLMKELNHAHLPTWDELYERYWKASAKMTCNRLKGVDVTHPRDVVPE